MTIGARDVQWSLLNAWRVKYGPTNSRGFGAIQAGLFSTGPVSYSSGKVGSTIEDRVPNQIFSSWY